MLIAYKIKKEGFSFEWQEWNYVIRFTEKGPRFFDESMEPVPAPAPKVIKRLISMMPHYSWGNVAD